MRLKLRRFVLRLQLLILFLAEPNDAYAHAAKALDQRVRQRLRLFDSRLPLAAKKDRQQVLLTAENDVFELNGFILYANAT